MSIAFPRKLYWNGFLVQHALAIFLNMVLVTTRRAEFVQKTRRALYSQTGNGPSRLGALSEIEWSSVELK
jgi:hypothetical protein